MSLEVVMSLNLYVFLWIAFTFFTFLITVSKINAYRAVGKRGATEVDHADSHFGIENSFYRTNASWHDIIFFHASASGLAAVLLILVIKGKMLFPGTETFFGIVAPVVIFIISITLLALAFYFFAISMLKLGTTLSKIKINNKEIKTFYATAGVFVYFVIFTVIVLLLV